MNHSSIIQRGSVFFIFIFSFYMQARFEYGDIIVGVSGKYRPESYLGKNTNLLNSCNEFDRLFWARHTLDIGVNLRYGQKTYGEDVIFFTMSSRNKARWGDSTGIANTTASATRTLDEVGSFHTHSIPRLFSWIQELWVEFDIAKAVGLSLPTKPKFTIGAFPFELGRGIAFGAAYAVGSEFIGFYSDAAIDQFAFGAKISDTFIKDILDFDFYVALLQSKAGSLNQSGAVILAQQIGRRDCPERGPFKINFAAASRFKWTVIDSEKYGKFVLEPYGMFNHDPEQRVEFVADAESKLLSLGLAGEYTSNRFELGFDYAVNLGRQRVKAWDRNSNQLENRNGMPTIVSSHAYANIDPLDSTQTANNDEAKFKAVNAKNTIDAALLIQKYGQQVQNIVDTAIEDSQFNGLLIGSVPGFSDAVHAPIVSGGLNKDNIYNAPNRFRREYKNTYEGWMIVGDAAVWILEKELRFAVTGGIASGDANPNQSDTDSVYSGFIPLQEFYFGDRVPSVFLLGSGSRFSRPLSQPSNGLQTPNRFASSIDGFSNLMLAGSGLLWQPASSTRKISVKPNVIAFWQHYPGIKFNASTGEDINELSSSYLGIEFNVFFDYMMFKNTKFFAVGSIFVPGKHFSDIKGRPINAAQERRLNRFNRTSITGTSIPNIGDNVAYTFNVGMEFRF